MHAHHYKGSLRAQRPPFGRGWGHGRREPMGPPRILPYLAAALLLRAAMRGAFSRHGHHGHGPWGGDQSATPYGPWGEGAPWRRGHGGHRHEHHHGHGGPGRGLRPEIGAIVGQLRGAFRDGTLDGRKVDEIRAVLADAQKRIAAILAESGARPAGSRPTEL